jgi:tetratricopeptide (TPR) repeat protein
MLDVGSFYFIFGGFVLMLMSSIVFQTPKQAKMVLFGIILSSVFVLIFQSVHLFMPTILSLGILTGKTGNILGSWNALGLFAGFSSLVFLLVIEFFSISKMKKMLLEIFILLSILLAATINFPLVWILLGISSLVIFVYKVSITLQKNKDKEEENEKKHFPMVSFVVMIIALLFFVSGQFGNVISNRLQISNTEINPSLGATMSITKGVLAKHPIFGIGPNRFGEAWSMYKPAIINNTQFWDTSFDSGSGLLPTFAATTGSLGIISWLVFLILFLIIGVRSVFSSIKNEVNWETITFFALSFYLLISSLFYSTGTAMFLLLFAFIGVFIGLVASNSNRKISISFLDDYRKSFFSILALILVVILSVAVSFKYTERFISVSYFSKALSAQTIPVAEDFIGKALSLYSNDLYLRTYSQIYLVKLNSIANKGSTLSDADKTDLQTSFDQAVNGAQMATAYDSSNYLNFQLLGSVYQTVGALGVKDAYSKAVLAYQNASNLNPLNPGLKLAMASALFADGKVKEAKDYANEALTLKPDYVDALITLSQIAKSEGNDKEALSYAQNALSLNPTDKNLIQYVNSLSNPPPSSSPASTTNKSKN